VQAGVEEHATPALEAEVDVAARPTARLAFPQATSDPQGGTDPLGNTYYLAAGR